jgi:hypothetical protein
MTRPHHRRGVGPVAGWPPDSAKYFCQIEVPVHVGLCDLDLDLFSHWRQSRAFVIWVKANIALTHYDLCGILVARP